MFGYDSGIKFTEQFVDNYQVKYKHYVWLNMFILIFLRSHSKGQSMILRKREFTIQLQSAIDRIPRQTYLLCSRIHAYFIGIPREQQLTIAFITMGITAMCFEHLFSQLRRGNPGSGSGYSNLDDDRQDSETLELRERFVSSQEDDAPRVQGDDTTNGRSLFASDTNNPLHGPYSPPRSPALTAGVVSGSLYNDASVPPGSGSSSSSSINDSELSEALENIQRTRANLSDTDWVPSDSPASGVSDSSSAATTPGSPGAKSNSGESSPELRLVDFARQ